MRPDINAVINLRQRVEWMETPELEVVDGEIRRRFPVPRPSVQYNIAGKVLEGMELNRQQRAAGIQKCYECSAERGRECMHYMDPCFDEFLTRERRHQKQMQAFYNLL